MRRLAMLTAFAAAVVVVFQFLSFCSLRLVYARDLDGQYANSPNKQWFANQRNKRGTSCCEIADGHHLDDADWKAGSDGNYWVRIDGNWVKVPDEAVIEPKDRPVDYAVVWIYNGVIFCFMVGTGS